MTGRFIDTIRYRRKTPPQFDAQFRYLDTDFGKLRVFDTGGNLPVVLNVPDGPNVIEHQLPLIQSLAKDHRVICFEYPGMGFSYPNSNFDYTFDHGSNLLLHLMDVLQLANVSLLFSCSNGYYAIQAASKQPDRFNHVFLSQTPSIEAINTWTKQAVPTVLKIPVLGQLTNAMYASKITETWYRYSLPKNDESRPAYTQTAQAAIRKGGCFCLSSLVQGLSKDKNTQLNLTGVPTTMVWGARDFTHRKTDMSSIKSHIGHCEVIEFNKCGHFPELENTKAFVQLVKERIGNRTTR